MPQPPEFDSDIQSIIEVYYLTARARRYVEGNALPLTVRDITDVVNAHPVNVPRSILDEIIFALDDLERSEQGKGKNAD